MLSFQPVSDIKIDIMFCVFFTLSLWNPMSYFIDHFSAKTSHIHMFSSHAWLVATTLDGPALGCIEPARNQNLHFETMFVYSYLGISDK